MSEREGLFDESRRYYHQFGCLTTILFFLGLITALVLSVQLSIATSICVACGPGAYFDQGVRFVNKQGLLSNGQVVPGYLTVPLFFAFAVPTLVGWMILVPLAVGRWRRWRDRRRRGVHGP